MNQNQDEALNTGHVLLVEAAPGSLAAVRAALAAAGYGITAVSHPLQTAVAWAQIDLLLLELLAGRCHLPEQLRQLDPHSRPKVLLLLSMTELDELENGLLADVDDYLVWPAPAAQLLARVRMQLRIRQTERQLHSREHFLQLLNQVTLVALQAQPYADMLQQLADRLGDLFAADGCYITRWDEEYELAYPGAAYGPMRDRYPRVRADKGEATLTEVVLQAGRVIAIEDTADSQFVSPRIAGMFPTRSILALPLIAQEHKLGAALIAFDRQRSFTSADIQRGEQVAAQLALALAQAALLDGERQQRKLAETLHEVTAALNSRLAPDELLNLILEQLGRVVPYHSASIMLLQDHSLRSVARRSIHPAAPGSTLDIRQFPHIQEVLETNHPVIIPDTQWDERWQSLAPTPALRCWMGVPLTMPGEVLGILNLSAGEPYFFRQTQAQVVTTFASQAAIAIRNARLYENLQHYAADLEAGVEARTHELTEAYERLQELDQLKSKFIDDISHELRTPVTNLALYLDLWERGKPERQDQYRAVLKQEMARLVQLVESIITMSQLDLLRGNVALTQMDVNELISAATAVFQTRLAGRAVRLAQDLAADLPPIRGDRRQILAAVTHLLDNALVYTTSGEISVHTFWAAHEQMIGLQIHDTGAGIASADLPHVFDRFYRGKGASQSNKPGMGLGLTIAQEIVHLHRGKIALESTVGAGTTVTVFFQPYVSADSAEHP